MSIIVRVPASLSDWFDGQDEVICQGRTVNECFEKLEDIFPGTKNQLIDKSGKLMAILVFLNGDNIRYLDGLETVVRDGDEIGIIPLAAGG